MNALFHFSHNMFIFFSTFPCIIIAVVFVSSMDIGIFGQSFVVEAAIHCSPFARSWRKNIRKIYGICTGIYKTTMRIVGIGSIYSHSNLLGWRLYIGWTLYGKYLLWLFLKTKSVYVSFIRCSFVVVVVVVVIVVTVNVAASPFPHCVFFCRLPCVSKVQRMRSLFPI